MPVNDAVARRADVANLDRTAVSLLLKSRVAGLVPRNVGEPSARGTGHGAKMSTTREPSAKADEKRRVAISVTTSTKGVRPKYDGAALPE